MKKQKKSIIPILIPILFFVTILFLLVEQASAKEAQTKYLIKGEVALMDGDSFDEYNKSGYRKSFRIAYIDAPEIYQNYGKKAKEELAHFIKGKKLTYKLVSNETDKYKRYLIELYANDVNVGRYMVKNGHAWAYTHDLNNLNKSYIALQNKAKQNKLGLWKERNPVDPYKIRNPSNREERRNGKEN